jgi:hypothetical protein
MTGDDHGAASWITPACDGTGPMASGPPRPDRAGGAAMEQFDERWSLDFASAELTGRLTLVIPVRGYVHFEGRISRVGEPLVLVRDDDVPRPRSRLEIRADGLWAELICETPLVHWSYGLEAFALELDEPDVTELIGHRIPLGWELEWEIGAEPVADPDGWGYEQEGVVHGTILIGRDRLTFAGTGRRFHGWSKG